MLHPAFSPLSAIFSTLSTTHPTTTATSFLTHRDAHHLENLNLIVKLRKNLYYFVKYNEQNRILHQGTTKGQHGVVTYIIFVLLFNCKFS